jgi:putative redox protein
MHPVRVRYASGKLRQEIYIGRHHLMADEPIEVGGEDSGPSPFEFLASALGACTAITLRMYAQRKSWPLENVEVTVRVERSKDLTHFDREMRLLGDLTDEQRQRLLEIAERCPVHKALSGKIAIKTRLETGTN